MLLKPALLLVALLPGARAFATTASPPSPPSAPLPVCYSENDFSEAEQATMVEQQTLYLYNDTTLPEDKSNIFNTYFASGLKWMDSYKDKFDPEIFTMQTVDSLTMVKYMQARLRPKPVALHHKATAVHHTAPSQQFAASAAHRATSSNSQPHPTSPRT